MRTIEQALLLKDKEEIAEEIEVRKELWDNMVGTLYKGIITEEIYILQNKYNNINDGINEV